MTKRRRPVIIISDDIPSEWLEFQLRGQNRMRAEIWSRSDALREAEAKRHRDPDPKQNHPQSRPRRGSAHCSPTE